MSQAVNFTKKVIDRLTWSRTSLTIYYDKKTDHFRLVISPKGKKTFQVYKKLNGAPTKRKVGIYPDMSPERAREIAKGYNKLMEDGIDPYEERNKSKNEQTYNDLWVNYFSYLKRKVQRNPKTAAKNIRQHTDFYNQYEQFHNLKLSEITKEKLVAFHREKSDLNNAPIMSNNIIRQIRACYNHNEIEPNPAANIKLNKSKSRSVYMTPEEAHKFIAAAKIDKSEDMGDLFLLALYTGARIGFIKSMEWDEVNLEFKIWAFVNKTSDDEGDKTVVGLIPKALEILIKRRKKDSKLSKWVFPAYSKTGFLMSYTHAFNRILKSAGLSGFTAHDLRRTVASWMAHDNASEPTIRAMLGNKSESTTKIYARMSTSVVTDKLSSVMNSMLKEV